MKKPELWRRRASEAAPPPNPGRADAHRLAAPAATDAAPPQAHAHGDDQQDTVPAAFYHSPD